MNSSLTLRFQAELFDKPDLTDISSDSSWGLMIQTWQDFMIFEVSNVICNVDKPESSLDMYAYLHTLMYFDEIFPWIQDDEGNPK